MSDTEKPIFKLLWQLANELDRYEDTRPRGTIISRYAGIIDDRLQNSGYSRSVDSLKLYDTNQLKEELKSRS